MKNLIGKKVKGFKFEDDKYPSNYNKEMDRYIGEVGEIITHKKDYNSYKVLFKDNFFYYPAELIEKHILEEFERGEVVLVRDNDIDEWYEETYITTIEGANYPFVVVDGYDKENFKKGEPFDTITYKQIKKKTKKLELTLEEIASKFNVDVKDLKIKK